MSAKRDACVQKLEGNINQWNVEIDQFQAKAYPARLDAQVQYRKQSEVLQLKRRALEGKIVKLQMADEAAWAGVKVGIDMAWRALGE